MCIDFHHQVRLTVVAGPDLVVVVVVVVAAPPHGGSWAAQW